MARGVLCRCAVLTVVITTVLRPDEIINFQFGQPTAWSLEQAHYLLSRMRHDNLDLPTRKPSEDDLSTNKVNNNRIQVLQTVLGGSVGYSQAIGQQNKLTQQLFDDREGRRSVLRTTVAQEHVNLDELRTALAALQPKRNAFGEKCPTTGTDGEACLNVTDAIKLLQDRIKTSESKIAAGNKELEGLGSPATKFETPDLNNSGTGSLQSPLKDSHLTTLMDKSAFSSPKLHASTMLDNFLQMQYEIIAKQVSLLRDEAVGFDGKPQRLIFLELPQTIYSRQKRWYHHQRLAQTYWQIKALYSPKLENPFVTPEEAEKRARAESVGVWLSDALRSYSDTLGGNLTNNEPRPTLLGAEARAQQQNYTVEKQRREEMAKQGLTLPELKPDPAQNFEVFLKTQCLKNVAALKPSCVALSRMFNTSRAFINEANKDARLGSIALVENDLTSSWHAVTLLLQSGFLEVEADETLNQQDRDRLRRYLNFVSQDLEFFLQSYKSRSTVQQEPCRTEVNTKGRLDLSTCNLGTGTPASEAVLKVVDLIPRQSALNVNEFHATHNAWNVSGMFTWLTGFGARMNFERRRELYEQFLYQEVFASGFGKGTTNFGWRFGSLPGEKQISPGLRNTYAVLVVPESATALEIEVYGCAMDKPDDGWKDPNYYSRGDCSERVSHTVALPPSAIAAEDFTVEKIRYNSVEPGGRATILIEGRNFGPQTAVLADGVALDRAISVTDMGLPVLARKRDPLLANGTIKGSFEVVNRNLIVVSLEAKPDFKQVPDLVLQTPTSARSVRELKPHVTANGLVVPAVDWWIKAPIYNQPKPPKEPALAIKSADFTSGPNPQEVQVILTGTFPEPKAASTTFRINGAVVAPVELAKSFAILNFIPDPALLEWSFVAYTKEEIKRLTVPNPRAPQRIEECDCSLLAGNAEAESGRRPSRASIELRGSGLLSTQQPIVSGATLESIRVHTPNLASILVTDASRRVRVQLGSSAVCVASCPRQ